jgi:protein AroM
VLNSGVAAGTMRAAFLTIGQSPRPDIMEDLVDGLKGMSYSEYGILDNYSLDRILKDFAPEKDQISYVTVLRDGTQVALSKKALSQKLQELVSHVESSVDVIVILCTGDFSLVSSKPIVHPSEALVELVKRSSPLSIGVMIPEKSQTDLMRGRWKTVSRVSKIVVWSPYTSMSTLTRVSRELKGSGTIVMECLGYSTKHRRLVEGITGEKAFIPRDAILESIANSVYVT